MSGVFSLWLCISIYKDLFKNHLLVKIAGVGPIFTDMPYQKMCRNVFFSINNVIFSPY